MTMPWTQARETARSSAKPLDAIEVPLAKALGMALAAPVFALTSQPTCDTSAMDGYAVAGNGPWTVIARIFAGDTPLTRTLAPGEAAEIATGAPVPSGAHAVVPVEHTHRANDQVHGEAVAGKHIRHRGEDWSAGTELIPAGTTISPAVLGLAAAAGHDRLTVHRRPRVAVVVTGDELLQSGPPHPGRVRDAIGPMLPGVLAKAEPLGTRHLPDNPAALTEALSSPEADVIVACGATSVGRADHLRPTLAELGADIVVNGVACRPGHPQLLAVLPDGRFVVGLPGNPFAALAACATLLRPLLDSLGGHVLPTPLTVHLTSPATAHPHDTRLIPVTRSGEPVGHDRPGSLWGAALADALAVVPPGHDGGEVELLPL